PACAGSPNTVPREPTTSASRCCWRTPEPSPGSNGAAWPPPFRTDQAYGEAMSSKHTLFRIFYRLGFTPWDGHPIAQTLRELVEGNDETPALPTGSALDLGCGTGDASIYLARHGWTVTGIDFVPKALEKARAKAGIAKASVDFVGADVTRLTQAGIGTGFELI